MVVVRLVAASREPVSEVGILKRCPVQRRFFLMRRYSIEGSPSRLRTFMFVTLSCHLIFMIDRRCLIMKACSFFTCLLYTVHVPAPYSKVDSMIAQLIFLLLLSFTGFSVVSSTLMSSSMVIVEFGWNITSVFFMFILRPNFDHALANASAILWISSTEWAISALSSAKSSSLTSIFVVLSLL